MTDVELEPYLKGLSLWAHLPSDPNASAERCAWVAQLEEQVLRTSFGWRLNDLMVGFLATFTPAQRAALSDAIHEGRVVFNWSTP